MRTEILFVCLALLCTSCVVQEQLPFDGMKLSFVKQETAPESLPVWVEEAANASEKPRKVQEPQPQEGVEKNETVAEKQPTEHQKPPEKKASLQILSAKDEIPTLIQGKIRLKKGEYTIVERITIAEGGSLEVSPGCKIELQQCGIVCKGSLIAKGTEKQPVSFFGPDGWDNITITGEKAKGVFHYCQISGGVGLEMMLNDAGKYVMSDDFGAGQSVGGGVLFLERSQGEVKNCTISNNSGKGAIALLDVENVVVTENQVFNNDEYGIFVRGGAPVLRKNKVENHSEAGMLCEGETKSQIEENNLYQNGKAGIRIVESAQPAIVKNVIEEHLAGIAVLDNSKITASGNTIKNNKSYGIICTNDSTVKLSENEFTSNGKIGIMLGPNAQGEIFGNKVSSHQYAVMVFTPSPVTVQNNTLEASTYGIIFTPNANPTGAQQNNFVNCQKNLARAPMQQRQ